MERWDVEEVIEVVVEVKGDGVMVMKSRMGVG